MKTFLVVLLLIITHSVVYCQTFSGWKITVSANAWIPETIPTGVYLEATAYDPTEKGNLSYQPLTLGVWVSGSEETPFISIECHPEGLPPGVKVLSIGITLTVPQSFVLGQEITQTFSLNYKENPNALSINTLGNVVPIFQSNFSTDLNLSN